ncbi:glycoside hydrolase family 92 protein [Acidomyces richmondensis BFW]|nr:MAG: glycoside hydrolase family 92 protein [Acidomyces sp. 'richmondensis']KYG45243.1 glycoside hydrolase family 92 protein [Acidomyces richmondensis BFW]
MCGFTGLVAALVAIFLIFEAQGQASDPFDALLWIDPLIGTAHGGHVFAGANIPYGMAKAVADCADDNAGGYSTDKPCRVIGFSHTHDSGTGGATSFGNFGLFPQTGCKNDTLTGCVGRAGSMEIANSTVATPGYFSIKLQNGVTAEMTTTAHTALYNFSFLEQEAIPFGPLIHVNLRDLYGSLSHGGVTVSEEGRMKGWGEYQPSFGPATYRLYFCADFNASVGRTGTWTGDSVNHQAQNLTVDTSSSAGAFVQFNVQSPANVLTRVGLSFISEEKACHNAEVEIPEFDFTATRDAATKAWRSKFENIAIDARGVSNETQRGFWSGIYRTMISPQDYTGENPLWESDEPYFDSFYCIWDSFRSTDPFLNIVDPDTHTLMVRALLDIYKHEGKLPDCRMSLCKGDTQGGSNADVLLADAYIKGLTKDVDWALAYEAVKSDAEDEPEDWSLEGRGNLESWKTLGYVPVDPVHRKRGEGLDSRSVSRTMEYAYNDFSVAVLAKSQNRIGEYGKYIERSHNWKNVFNPDTKSLIRGTDSGFKGFVQPRFRNGTFKYEDPSLCNPITGMERACFLFEGGYSTYEGGSWLYSFFVPHDMAALIELMGGKETFVKRLQYFHETGLADISDEQAFLTVFLFHYAGRPGLSSVQAHKYLERNFSSATNGLPGNDDSGSMGSFLAFCMMGFFPNPGQDVYLLSVPYFREIRLTHAQTRKVAIIKTVNFDPSRKAHYIKAVKLNGRTLNRSWITHDFFVNGGILELVVNEEETDWGTRDEDLPPSLSTSREIS